MTTVDITGKATPTVTVSPVPAQVAQPLSQQVNKVLAAAIPAHVMVKVQAQKFEADELTSPWFRCLLYGDIDAGKTVTAATFDTPENTRIIMTRQKEQATPLKGLGYKLFHANTSEMLKYALMYPEAIWPEWAELSNRTLVVDDLTQANDILNDDNSVDASGREIADIRRKSKGAKDDLREMLQLSALQKPMNLILVALERSWEEGKTTLKQPDLPQGMSKMVRADAEWVLCLRKVGNQRVLLTETDREAYVKKDEKGKDDTYYIERFARYKMSKLLVGKGIVKPKEQADLRALWERVKAGKVG